MALTCFVPWPAAGSGGCPCGTYPNPCGTSGDCLPQTQHPPVSCFPPAEKCRALGQCTTCEWIAPATFQQCGGGGGAAVGLTLAGAAAAALVFAVHHRGGHRSGLLAAPPAHGFGRRA